MKADKTIRLLKHVPALNIGFTAGGTPYFSNISGIDQVNNGWEIDSLADDPKFQNIGLEWNDTIDISGLRAADLTMINQGGAIAFCRPPIVTWPENATVTVTTYVSVNPIRGNYTERVTFGNSLATPSESQDWFLASSQTYVRDSTSAGFAAKIAENNWGTGGIAQTDRLFVRCFVAIVRQALFVPSVNDPTAQGYAPLDPDVYFATTSPMTIGIMAVTAELDSVQTAAAIYRGNDLQQTYDNP